jgi:hypothetical protein
MIHVFHFHILLALWASLLISAGAVLLPAPVHTLRKEAMAGLHKTITSFVPFCMRERLCSD